MRQELLVVELPILAALLDPNFNGFPRPGLPEFTAAVGMTQYSTALDEFLGTLFPPQPMVQLLGQVAAAAGKRISAMTLDGKPLEADKRYKVVSWAPVAEGTEVTKGEPVWDLVERYLKDRKTITPRAPNVPRLIGVEKNPGLAGLA